MSTKLFVISIVMIASLLIGINYNYMHEYYTYVLPIKNSKIFANYTHFDIMDLSAQEAVLSHKKNMPMTSHYFNETSQTLHIKHDTYTTDLEIGDSGILTCFPDVNKTHMDFFQNLGMFERGNKTFFVTLHFTTSTPEYVPCDFPDVAIHSYNSVRPPIFTDKQINEHIILYENRKVKESLHLDT